MFHYKQLQPKFDLASHIAVLGMGFMIPISVTGFAVFLILTLVFFILSGNFKAKFRPLMQNQVLVFALAFFLLLVISAGYSTGTRADIVTTLGKYSKLLYLIFLMPLFMNERWQKAGINAFLAAMLVTLAASYLKMFGWIHVGNAPGLGTIFTNHINTGFLMAYAAFIVAHRCFNREGWQRAIYIVLLLVITFNIFFMNEGRTGFLVYLVLLVVFLGQKLSWKGVIVALILAPLLSVVLFFVSNNFKHRVAMITNDINNYQQHQLNQNSIGLRIEFTKNSMIQVIKHPLVGTGVGSFRQEYLRNFPPDPGFLGMSNPQNEFLMVAVQLGMIGLLVFLWLFYVAWRSSLALPAELKYLAQGMIVAFLVGSLCDTFLYLGITGYFLVYFTSLFYAKLNQKVIQVVPYEK